MMYYINRAGIYGCLDPVEKLRPVSPIPIIIKQMLSITLTFDEAYQMNKLYETMLDKDMIDECPQEIENVFDKIRDAQGGQY